MLKWISEQGPKSKYLSFYSPSCCFQTCMTYFHGTLEKIEGCSLVVAQKHHLTYHKSGPYDICDFILNLLKPYFGVILSQCVDLEINIRLVYELDQLIHWKDLTQKNDSFINSDVKVLYGFKRLGIYCTNHTNCSYGALMFFLVFKNPSPHLLSYIKQTELVSLFF